VREWELPSSALSSSTATGPRDQGSLACRSTDRYDTHLGGHRPLKAVDLSLQIRVPGYLPLPPQAVLRALHPEYVPVLGAVGRHEGRSWESKPLAPEELHWQFLNARVNYHLFR
jgi:hypothetical protein